MVFFTCVLKISNHFIHFSLRNSELNVKNNTFFEEINLYFYFLLGKTMDGWENYTANKCDLKCSILIYIYFFNWKKFFLNLYLDRVDPGARRVLRFRRSIFRRYWVNRVKTREGIAGVHCKGDHYEREHCIFLQRLVNWILQRLILMI